MRASSIIPLWGLLVVGGLLALACREGNVDPGGDEAVADGGHPAEPEPPAEGEGTPGEDGGLEGGATAGCDVVAQQGCDAGVLCLGGMLADGGTGNQCFPGECDPVAQDCPEGSKCAYMRQGSATERRCVPEGTVEEGGACQSTATPEGDFYDTCRAGLHCTDQPGEDGGVVFFCRRFCHEDARCTALQACVEVLRFQGSEELPRVCGEPEPRCDLLSRDCASPRGCYPTPSSGAVCVTAGTMEDGTPCTYSNDCQPGSACVRGGAGLECRRLCRYPTGAPGCTQGHCEPLRGYTDTGACVP